ncbi:DUF402 domain-containing protein [Streptomyces sp. NPDC088551]|uniref:DUF402 domain-containing protein n=1 Tax=Streptomyces sp. NPDC088551 TaxID=3365863 RepID=UPI00380A2F16
MPGIPVGMEMEEETVHVFEAGQTVVRRDVHRSGRVWTELALRVVADTDQALVTACTPGAEARWPALYAKAHTDEDRSVRTEAFEAMASGRWELAATVWQETDLLLWKPPAAWFSVNAFFVPDGEGRRLRNWYVNFEHPTRRRRAGFDTFDLTVDLVVTPDLTRWEWKDEDEYAHVRRLGIVSDLPMSSGWSEGVRDERGGRHGHGRGSGRAQPGCAAPGPAAPAAAERDIRVPPTSGQHTTAGRSARPESGRRAPSRSIHCVRAVRPRWKRLPRLPQFGRRAPVLYRGRRLCPWDAVQVGPLPHPMDAWSVEESFDDLLGDLAADLFGRLFRNLLDEFPEDVVHMLNPFLSALLTRGTREVAAGSWASGQRAVPGSEFPEDLPLCGTLAADPSG